MKKLLISLFALLAMVACSEGGGTNDGGGNSNNEQPKLPEITLDATAVNFSADGGSTIVTFTSSDEWTAEAINNRADAWCSVSPTSGSAGASKITITTTANDTTDDRSATIEIKSGFTRKTITVSQKQKDAITATASNIEISSDGGEISVEVKANIGFYVLIEESAKSWVKHKSTRAMKTSNVILEVAKNDDSEKRVAKVNLWSGGITETITIYQEGSKPSIVLSENEYSIPSIGETIAVEVKSNVDVTVEMPKDAGWITENTTRGVSTNTYYFDITQNDSYDSRSAKIKFINKENNISETITITQSQKDAIVIAEDSYVIGHTGGEIDIEVSHNVEFDIKIDGNWITQKQTRGLEIEKLTFIVDENKTDKTRESSITFTSKDGAISQVISIFQESAVYDINISLNKSKVTMMVGDEITLLATITPEYAINKAVLWSSDNPTVASVDNGKVKAHQLGTATITATTQDGGKTASCIISVVEIDSMIDISFSGMIVSSYGSVSFEGDLIKLTSGVKLGVSISNYSTRNIMLTGFKLICGKQNTVINYTLDEMEISGNTGLELTVPINSTIYSPIAEIAYRYDSKTYTARVQFNGMIK